ncbi:MAG: hypothetical protein ACR2OZ_05415 [Verrucomicrobiales bacterium]
MKIIKHLKFVSGLVPVGNGRGTARSVVLVSLGVAAVVTALVGVALATPPSGIVSATVVARASFADPVDVKFKIGEPGQEVVIHARELQDTVIQQIIIGPGGSTGWHTHPGPVVVLITAGELTLYSSEDPTCTPRTYSAGEAFVDSGQGHVHIARNLSGQNVELWATYFDVPPGGPFRLDAANPGNCGF